ncbi:hypothetical protein KO507_19550 [Gilvimarinus agarilyticus]|uniref:Uncharacterized protein n=1 Tax=Reichenbachiella agariperforans TaxID=156994 RepID=A0A1M6K4K4_REIAG|nr:MULTISPECIES: DUF6768 family protein [Reichenbachiella]MBU2887970.1 hypothetical protein [Gilvimarinus agarilyticus]MBU2913418.1 hypothetical protein [Reichenbachiella agariperforans]RJE74604.1 hypothetical protein BGP76_15800 [Reichenbachiella sp. MSK19-1]SHJ53924.1 hypothetical protein SAMN04488028_101441 [Reichenbachiella agariperforans]
MKDQNKEIDDMIKKALSKEETAYYDNLHEQSLPEMLSGLYIGKLRWLNILFMVVTFLFTTLMFYSIYQFVNTDDIREMIRWGAAMFGSGIMASMIKVWNWNQLDKNALMREIKRLELLLVSKS